MGIKQVQTFQQMIIENRLFWKRVQGLKYNMLFRMAKLNKEVSRNIAEKNKFRGILISGIDQSTVSRMKHRVISSAPHSAFMEDGVKPHWVHRDQLDGWIESKLPSYKGDYLLVGKSNSDLGKGIHFMLKGFNVTVQSSDRIIQEELNKINAFQ